MQGINYGVIANSYDELHGEEQLEKYRAIRGFLNSINALSIDSWLDIGSGTGLLQEFFSNTRFVCVEPSNELSRIHLEKNRPGGIINKRLKTYVLKRRVLILFLLLVLYTMWI